MPTLWTSCEFPPHLSCDTCISRPLDFWFLSADSPCLSTTGSHNVHTLLYDGKLHMAPLDDNIQVG